MDTDAVPSNTGRDTIAELNEERAPDNTALNEGAAPLHSDVYIHPSPVTDGDDLVAREQIPIHPFKDPLDTQTARNGKDRKTPPSNLDHVLPMSREVLSSADGMASAAEPTLGDVNESETHTIVHPLEALSSLPETAPLDHELDSDEPLKRSQIVRSEPDSTEFVRPNDGEETQEDFGNLCDDIASSVPPSSSPPQLFSSSPCPSSQSSESDVELSKMIKITSSHNPCCGLPPVSVQHDSESLFRHDVATSLMIDTSGSDILPPPYHDCGVEPSEQGIACQSNLDESYGSRPVKRQKSDHSNYLLPAPKRATLASQNRQFKKLAAPFRPPVKLPVAMDRAVQTRNGVEPTTRSTDEMNRVESKPREPTRHPFLLQHKALNKPRSIPQFKSPLVNRVLPTEIRTIRLTPAVQALERKLQLLKRAVKVKENKEEEVLVRLADKWIEAGREVAYDVWDATKDAGGFGGKGTFVRKPCGWGLADDGNVPWGWATKPGDADESGHSELSEVACAIGQMISEEDEDGAGCNTLGTMLRHLGIAPEIFGWDDDKEAFSD